MRLLLFGAPRLDRGQGPPTPLPWNRPAALLAVLGCHPQGIGRDALATLLRPDDDPATSRAHLRRQLHRARALLPGDHPWPAEERQLRWAGQSDVAEFLDAFSRGDWAQAVQLQPAPLLAGAGALGDGALDDWIGSERERLQAKLRVALLARLRDAAPGDGGGHGAGDDGCDDDERARLVTRLVDLDPLDETLLQAALEQVRGPTSRAAALAACRMALARLRDELGLAPTPALTALIERVGSGDRPAAAAVAPRAAPRSFGWVDSAAPLFGRDAEVAALSSRLDDGSPQRLVTLLGLGGTGKTRLALAVASQWRGEVVRVDLSSAKPGDDLAALVAEAAGLQLGSGPAQAQWLSWLQRRALAPALLVLLDNFESLAGDADARAALAAWLEAAPGLRLLVTSREALGLASEARVELGGLDPARAAQQLLLHHAQRLGVPLSPDDSPWLRRLAEALQGHPLGLELAASWLPVMPPREIVGELARGLAFLADDDVANEGQRSLRAVFGRSWALLDAAGQQLLAALTVFPAGFDLEAARAVAGATPRSLLKLASQSLLQRASGGRFELHPMVRRFAARELADARRARLREALAEHVTERIAALPSLGLGRLAPDTSAWLRREARNIAAAWHGALAARRFDLVTRLHASLADFMTAPARASTMEQFWGRAARALPEAHPLRSELELARAGALANLGRHAESEVILASLTPRVQADPRQRSIHATARAIAAWWRGDLAAVRTFTDEALHAATQADDPFLEARAHQNLAARAQGEGRAADAEAHALRMLALARTHGAEVFAARAERMLAALYDEQRRFEEALRLLQSSTSFFEALGEGVEVANNLVDMAAIARRQHRHDEQRRLAERAVVLVERSGVPDAIVHAQLALGIAERDLGDHAAAAQRLAATLPLALRLRRARHVRRLLAHLALLQADRTEGADRGATLMALAALVADPALRPDDRAEVESAWVRLQPDALERQRLAAAAHAVDEVAALWARGASGNPA